MQWQALEANLGILIPMTMSLSVEGIEIRSLLVTTIQGISLRDYMLLRSTGYCVATDHFPDVMFTLGQKQLNWGRHIRRICWRGLYQGTKTWLPMVGIRRHWRHPKLSCFWTLAEEVRIVYGRVMDPAQN